MIVELTSEILKNVVDYKSLYETLSNLSPSPECSLEECIENLELINKQNSHLFVYIKDEKIVSCATLIIEQKFIRGHNKVAHIEDVATHKEYLNNGYAKEIINHCIDMAKKNGCYKVILDCSDDLVSFYDKFGFLKKGNLMDYRF